MGLMNHKAEKELSTIYRSNEDPEIYMTIDSLVTLAIKGFSTCPDDSLKTGDYCASRKISGYDACECIRNTFPTPEYYELYLRLRNYYLQNVGRTLLAKIAGEVIGENNNE